MANPSMAVTGRAGLPEKQSGRWTLLLVAEDGRLRQVPRLKALLTAGVVALGISAVCALVLWVLLDHSRRQEAELARQLAATQRSLAQAREQHQLLVAQAALGSQTAPDQPQSNARAIADQPSGTKTGPEVPPAPVTANLVEAEELSFFHNKGSRQFQVQFKLKNHVEADPVVGYVFVVLHPLNRQEGQVPVVIPDAPLEQERPAAHKSGRPFTIARFTTIRLDGRDNDPRRFAMARVVVFDKDGRLLLEQRFDLKAADGALPRQEM